jgi:hypothetical protein
MKRTDEEIRELIRKTNKPAECYQLIIHEYYQAQIQGMHDNELLDLTSIAIYMDHVQQIVMEEMRIQSDLHLIAASKETLQPKKEFSHSRSLVIFSVLFLTPWTALIILVLKYFGVL